MIKSKLNEFNLNGQRVFLRADLNVPLKNGIIINDFRLKQILPTIDIIQKKGGKIILATHIDRPEFFDPNLSTKKLINWFEKNNYKINFESDLDKAHEKSLNNKNEILLLENLRFFPEEKNVDVNFAKKLAKLADFYINDAFGVSHRNDTSVTLLAAQFPKDKRTIGLLMENEIKSLNKLNNPDHPFLLIIGGGKVKDKILFLENLIDNVDTIALCPAIVFTFLKANNKETGLSLVEPNLIDYCKNFELKAEEKKIELLFPKDYIVAKDNFFGKLSTVLAENFGKNDFGISIGSETVKVIIESVKKAKTIFFNGLPGDINRKETMEPIKEIYKAASENKNAYTLIGGGESVAAAYLFGLEEQFDHLSTGGGAVLAYLSNKKLPGLKFLED